MSAYIIKNRINKQAYLKSFNEAGYSFNDELSDENDLVFTRN